jgi:hypothetical protein
MSAAPYTGQGADDESVVERPSLAFRQVLEASPDSLSIMSAVRNAATGEIVDFQFDYVNRAGALMQGSTPDDMRRQSLLERHPGAMSSGLFGAYVRAVETGEPYDEEIP